MNLVDMLARRRQGLEEVITVTMAVFAAVEAVGLVEVVVDMVGSDGLPGQLNMVMVLSGRFTVGGASGRDIWSK